MCLGKGVIAQPLCFSLYLASFGVVYWIGRNPWNFHMLFLTFIAPIRHPKKDTLYVYKKEKPTAKPTSWGIYISRRMARTAADDVFETEVQPAVSRSVSLAKPLTVLVVG